MNKLKELVTAQNVAELSEEERTVRISLIELAQWCQDRLALLEQGRKIGFQIAVSQQAADAIEAALPYPDGARVVANMLRGE